MTDLEAIWDNPDSLPSNTGAVGRSKCRRHDWMTEQQTGHSYCNICGTHRDPVASRRGRSNRKRGNRAELAVARLIPGARKMGPLGLPWDVEVGTYARLQVKKLARRPGPAEIARLIAAIPDTGDRLRGFVWVEAAGQGKRGAVLVWFLSIEFARWHGEFYPFERPVSWSGAQLLSMTLADWAAEFVTEETPKPDEGIDLDEICLNCDEPRREHGPRAGKPDYGGDACEWDMQTMIFTPMTREPTGGAA